MDFTVRIPRDDADFARVDAVFGVIEGPDDQAYCQACVRHPRSRDDLTRYVDLTVEIVAAALLRHDRLLVDAIPLDAGFTEKS